VTIGGGIPGLGPGSTWESLLGAPTPGQHIMQLYTRPDVLVRAVTRYASEGLCRGEAVLLVTRAAHGQAIRRGLTDRGFALEELSRSAQLIVLDATETLESLLVDGGPDRSRFDAVIGRAVEAAAAAGHRPGRAFGEMVDIMRRDSLASTLRLEDVWAEFLTAHPMALVCGYFIDNFDPECHHGLLQWLGAAHSHLVPVEDTARLDAAVEHAYAEVFGAESDAALLRGAFLAAYPRPTAMPDAEAAILAARELVPAAVADALLERARHHYDNPAPAV
jgi:hypothetical protein